MTRRSRTTGSPTAGSSASSPSARRRSCSASPSRRTGDPTGQYARYSFQYANFPDYPKLGVWPDAYYTTFNMFNASGTSFLGPQVCAYDRAKMLAAQAATQQCVTLSSTFGSLLPSDLDGPTAPPAGRPNYLLSFGTNALQMWKFHVDWATPANTSLTGPTNLTTARVLARVQRRRHVHPAAGHDQQARLARRPADVPARVPQLRRPRVARRRTTASPPAAPSACAGTSSATRTGRRRSSSRARTRPTRRTAGWARSRWTTSATSRSATACRAARCTRASATPAGSPATRSAR